jgi:hypothetical protein
MPWHCPACRTEIKHDALDALPRANVAYRCHVCRLDLRFDEALNHLQIAPLENGQQKNPVQDRPRTIPPMFTPPPRKPPKGS